MRIAIALIALLVALSITCQSMLSIYSEKENILIYRLIGINNTYNIIAVDEENAYTIIKNENKSIPYIAHLYIPLNATSSKIPIVSDIYALKGDVIDIAKSALYEPNYISIVTSEGEIITLNSLTKALSVKDMKFHGVPSYLKIFTTDNGVVSVQINNILRMYRYDSESWCEIGATVGNATVDHAEGYLVIDHVMAVESSDKGLSYVPIAALTFEKVHPPNIIIKVLRGNVSVARAIVRIVYDGKKAFLFTDDKGTAGYYIPVNVSKIEIEAFYINESEGGLTYYGKQVIKGPLEPDKIYHIEIQLTRTPIAVPSIEKYAYVRIFKLYDIKRCSYSLENPLIEEIVYTSDPSSVRLHLLYVKNDMAVLLLSYQDVSYLGSAYPKLELQVVDLDSESIVKKIWYRLFSPIIKTAISDDGKVIAVVTSNKLLYLFYDRGDLDYELVESYRLLSIPTSMVLLSGVGRYGDTYALVLGYENGFISILGYRGSIGSLKPLSRHYTLGLYLEASPAYIDAIPQLKLLVMSSPRGVLYVRDLGKHIEDIVGEDLGKYVAKKFLLMVIDIFGKPIALNATFIGSPIKTLVLDNGTIEINNIEFKNYTIVVKPLRKYMPRVYMNISINYGNIELKLSAREPITNSTLAFSKLIVESSNRVKEVVLKNSSIVDLVLEYGKSYSIELYVDPISIQYLNTKYMIKLYDTISLDIDLSRDIAIKLQLPERSKAHTLSICLFSEDKKHITNAIIELVGLITREIYEPRLDNSTKCFIAKDVVYDLYRVKLFRVPPIFITPSENPLIIVNSTHIKKSIVLNYRPILLILNFTKPPVSNLVVFVNGTKYDVSAGSTKLRIDNLKPSIYNITIVPLKHTIENFTINNYEKYFKIINLTNSSILNIELIPKKARMVVICLLSEDNTPIANASLKLVGFTLGEVYKLRPNSSIECFTTQSVSYDLYYIEIVKIPPIFLPPEKYPILLVNSTTIKKSLVLKYKPITLTLNFVKPPITDLEVFVDGVKHPVVANSTMLKVDNLKPGVHNITIIPLKTLRSFGNSTISYYKKYIRIVHLRNSSTIDIDLIPVYRHIFLELKDSLTNVAPIGKLELYIDKELIAVLQSKDFSKPLIVEGYIPLGKVNISVVSKDGIYRPFKEIINSSAIGDKLKVLLHRVFVPITINTLSDLGELLSGVEINATCGKLTLSTISIEGAAQLYVPVYTNCILTAKLSGYDSVTTQIAVGLKPTSISITLKTQILTLIMKHLTLIIAVGIIATIASIIVYLRKRIIERLRETSEELI